LPRAGWLSDLDFGPGQTQKQGKVSAVPATFYASLRRHARPAPTLHEGRTEAPPERLLQVVWQHQRLRRDTLRTTDGRHLTVLHPGFASREPGPDFRNALIQFDAASPATGDIEVDLQSAGWRGHGHDRNPAFARVILHVVWEAGGKEALPTLALKDVLDAPLAVLAEWLGSESAQQLPLELTGQCHGPLKELSAETLRELLHQAALTRLQAKASAFAARARHAGWEQSLWEGLFRALGYKHNPWPLQRLAEVIAPLRAAGQAGQSALHWQARLLGVAGLLPAELNANAKPETRNSKPDHLRRLWDIWWRERDQFADAILPRTAWRFAGIRPANHPQRRLALAAHWLAAGDLPARIERWFTGQLPDGGSTPSWAGPSCQPGHPSGRAGSASLPASPHHCLPDHSLASALLEALQPPADDFWSRHWTFNSAPMPKPQPLLGATRATDLAINVILPWLWSRADAGDNTALRREAERRYLAWPAAEDNAVLKHARQRLLGGRSLPRPLTAALQQGLLQVVRDFCDHSNAICEQCQFPELIRQLAHVPQG
jgi:hypothetical protein